MYKTTSVLSTALFPLDVITLHYTSYKDRIWPWSASFVLSIVANPHIWWSGYIFLSCIGKCRGFSRLLRLALDRNYWHCSLGCWSLFSKNYLYVVLLRMYLLFIYSLKNRITNQLTIYTFPPLDPAVILE